MKLLITGGAGFIGCNTAAAYLREGHEVTLFDNFSRPQVDQNLTWLQSLGGNLNILKQDVRDFAALQSVIKDQAIIFHFAGQTAVTTSISNPSLDFQTNALGTFNLLEAVRLENPGAIVLYTSTNKVYGALSRHETIQTATRVELKDVKSINELEPLEFYSPYGCSKGAGDQYMIDYARIYHLKTIVFRQSCIYGEHQFGVEDQGWVAHFATKALKQETINLFGSGHQVRDLLYIGDLIDAYQKAIKSIATTAGNVYNIGGGEHNLTSLLELIEAINMRTGFIAKTKFFQKRAGDQDYYVSNTTKAQNDFGWQPTTTIATGLDRLIAWLKSYYQL